MKTKISSILVILLCILSACKNECKKKRTYRIQVNYSNGTTQAVYYNLPVSLVNSVIVNNSLGYTRKQLAEGTTDSHGNVTLSYSVSDCEDLNLVLYSDINTDFPVEARKNIDHDTVYVSTMGTIKLNLVPKSNFNNGDTLYLRYIGSNNPAHMETCILPTSIKNINWRVKTDRILINYGVGYNKFVKTLSNNPIQKQLRVKGDPYIDTVNVVY